MANETRRIREHYSYIAHNLSRIECDIMVLEHGLKQLGVQLGDVPTRSHELDNCLNDVDTFQKDLEELKSSLKQISHFVKQLN